jgi:predicted transposase YbfD/YdcC
MLEIAESVITIDAMGGKKDIRSLIVKKKGGSSSPSMLKI